MNIKRLSILLLVLSASVFAYAYGIFDTAQESLTDRFFLRTSQPQNILIVAVDDASLKVFGQWPWKREVIAKTIDALQDAQAIGVDINFSEMSRFGAEDDQVLAQALQNSQVPVVLPVELRADGKVRVVPLPTLLPYAHLGFVNIIKDVDGTVRKIETLNEGILSFSHALISSSTLPQDMRIKYVGPAGTFLTVSLVDVVNGMLPSRITEGAHVLIGVTASSLRDNSKTPFGDMPGVEIHANALNTMLEGTYLKDISKPLGSLAVVLASVIASLLVISVRRFRYLASGLVGLVVVVAVISFVSFDLGIIFPLLYLLFAILISAGGMLGFQYITESKEKRFIRQSFQYYLSPAVINQIIEHPENLRLGGEKREVTILFSDIRGFTSISEQLSPEQLVQVMNEYLTAMTDIIMKYNGVVDKYIGDAIMAFWGAPVTNQQHAQDAVLAALEMIEKLKEMNAEWRSRSLPPLAIGIGISTGEVIVGNMGSNKRFNYTIMGDEVNFSSRLEGLNKMYGTTCVVGEATVQKTNGIGFRLLDSVTVKGKAIPKNIFELMEKDSPRLCADFAKGREYYQKGEWDDAIRIFELLVSEHNDGPSKILLERSKDFKQNPPSEWNGVWEFHDK